MIADYENLANEVTRLNEMERHAFIKGDQLTLSLLRQIDELAVQIDDLQSELRDTKEDLRITELERRVAEKKIKDLAGNLNRALELLNR